MNFGCGFSRARRERVSRCLVPAFAGADFPETLRLRDPGLTDALLGPHLSDIDVEVADRVALELLPCWLVALDIGQAANAGSGAKKTASDVVS